MIFTLFSQAGNGKNDPFIINLIFLENRKKKTFNNFDTDIHGLKNLQKLGIIHWTIR